MEDTRLRELTQFSSFSRKLIPNSRNALREFSIVPCTFLPNPNPNKSALCLSKTKKVKQLRELTQFSSFSRKLIPNSRNGGYPIKGIDTFFTCTFMTIWFHYANPRTLHNSSFFQTANLLFFSVYEVKHPNNVGRCGHICNASYAVAQEIRGLHIGEKLVLDCLAQAKRLGFGT